MDEEKLSPARPQLEPSFAQAIPKLITRPGDNLFTRIGDTAGTCAVYAQKLSPGIHRVWENRVVPRGYVPYVAFASYGQSIGSTRTLVDYLWSLSMTRRGLDGKSAARARRVIGKWLCAQAVENALWSGAIDTW